MVLLLEIALAVVLSALLVPWFLLRRRPPGRRGRRGDGDQSAGDRAGRTPRVPTLSGGAARKLGEGD